MPVLRWKARPPVAERYMAVHPLRKAVYSSAKSQAKTSKTKEATQMNQQNSAFALLLEFALKRGIVGTKEKEERGERNAAKS